MTEETVLSAEHKALVAKYAEANDDRIAFRVVRGELLIFRAPELEEFEDYQSAVLKGKARGACNRELAQLCQVYPESDAGLAALQSTFRKYPAISTKISDALCELAGATAELTVKND